MGKPLQEKVLNASLHLQLLKITSSVPPPITQSVPFGGKNLPYPIPIIQSVPPLRSLEVYHFSVLKTSKGIRTS